jgi:hypothetical protein
MSSDHYNHVVKRAVNKTKATTRKETAAEEQPKGDHHHYATNATGAEKKKILAAACDRRLSRAAREIVKQKLLQALLLVDDGVGETKTTIMIPTTKILSSNTDPAQFSVWELLESVTAVPAAATVNSNHDTNDDSSSSSSSSFCWLQAPRDVLRYHEEHVSIIKADLQGYRGVDTPTANRRHVVNQFKSHWWYQCMLCGKVFASRFYLDRHLERMHHHHHHHHPPPPALLETERLLSEEEDNSNSHHHHRDIDDDGTFWICPATDWCGNFLSLWACHEMALTLEPHYGPGRSSSNSRGDRGAGVGVVERRLWKEAHEQPCTTSDMQAATVSCRNMIQSCFFPQQQQQQPAAAALLLAARQRRIGQALENSLCSTLSCPDRLHRLFFQTKTGGDLVMRHVHEWQDEWLYWNEDHHDIGWFGLILLLLLAVWYANAVLQHFLPRLRASAALVPAYYFRRDGKTRKIPKAQGSRLLRKSPTKTSTARITKTKES